MSELHPALRRRDDEGETTQRWEAFILWATAEKPSLRDVMRETSTPYSTLKRWKRLHCWSTRLALKREDDERKAEMARREQETRQEALERVKTEAETKIEAIHDRSKHLEAVAYLATARAEQILKAQLAGDPVALKQSAAGVAQLLQAATRSTEAVLRDAAFSDELRGIADFLEELEREQEQGQGKASSWQSGG